MYSEKSRAEIARQIPSQLRRPTDNSGGRVCQGRGRFGDVRGGAIAAGSYVAGQFVHRRCRDQGVRRLPQDRTLLCSLCGQRYAKRGNNGPSQPCFRLCRVEDFGADTVNAALAALSNYRYLDRPGA